MCHLDLAILVQKLDEWTDLEENVARILDRLDYWLGTEYTQWTTDPEDPEIKRARAERKRAGYKAPPHPIVFPVAKRPERIHMELLLDAHQEFISFHPEKEKPRDTPMSSGADKSQRKKGTIRQLLAARGE
ncbi:hypothetical protein CBE89_00010 [Corynebacterium striatum]|uniref:Uncharacterized protein n=1 Tax=Corynebacterium striatum TaxID=43770 RepID=A0A2Z2IWJ1_CORST|nr:hypothetical protein [Corynebacterium striatum]ART20063.1 hypothetical protein CBE89_00010 [Corynebacterium striatum]